MNASLETLDEDNAMERGLTNRHVQFIAIGGAIGTGLFLGSGKSIALDGPNIVLIYILVGGFMFLMMRAIGELMYRDPSQHTFINFIRMYLGNGAGKFALWTYWLVLILTGMTELSAVGVEVFARDDPDRHERAYRGGAVLRDVLRHARIRSANMAMAHRAAVPRGVGEREPDRGEAVRRNRVLVLVESDLPDPRALRHVGHHGGGRL